MGMLCYWFYNVHGPSVQCTVLNLSTKGTFPAMFAYQRVLLQHLGHYQTKMKNLGFVQQGSRVVYPWHQAKGVLIMISYIHMYFFIVLLFL